MNERLRIGAREVGPGCPTFTIAEIGVNHDGDVGLALHLVRAAAAAGADAIKLQLFRADRLVDASAGCCEYQNADSQMELLRRYELTTEEVGDVVDAARAAGLVPLATPFSVQDVAVCRELAFPAVKIASPDLVNRPLLREAAKLGVPMLISTGASDEQEIVDTEAWLEGMAVPHVLLHCVSSYPTAMDEARLDWIGRLAEISVWPVGYSDHTTSPLAGALAVAAGACVLEKHLTHDRDAEGPDHAASFEPHELNYYIHQVRVAERMTGVGPRRVLPCEAEVRRLSRQRLVYLRDLPPGHVLEWEDLATRRPAESGVLPVHAGTLVGRTLARACPAGRPVALTDLQPAASTSTSTSTSESSSTVAAAA